MALNGTLFTSIYNPSPPDESLGGGGEEWGEEVGGAGGAGGACPLCGFSSNSYDNTHTHSYILTHTQVTSMQVHG